MFLDAVRSAELYTNVSLETSGAQVADLIYAVEHIGTDRILFRTDLPIGGAASAIAQEDCQRAIFGESALRLSDEVTNRAASLTG